MKAKYLFTGLAATSLIVASCNDKSSGSSTPEASAPKSEESAEPISENTPDSTVAAEPTPEPLAAPTTKIAKELSGKAHVMVGGEYKETQIKDAPYYLFYFTASW